MVFTLVCAAVIGIHIYLWNSFSNLLWHMQAGKRELIKSRTDLGVPTDWSEADPINRLEEMILHKDVYP